MRKSISSARLWFMAIILFAFLALYATTLYKLQIIEGDAYYESSTNSVVTTQTVTAARGDILDRYGRTLVSNSDCYNITFDDDRLFDGDVEDVNALLLELVELVYDCGDTYIDELPITMEAPFEYTEMTSIEQTRLSAYLVDKGLSADTTAVELMSYFRTRYDIDNNYTAEEMRIIAGLRYEINVRYCDGFSTSSYVFVEDASTELISKILESYNSVVDIETSYVREYHTQYAAHLLGYIGAMDSTEYATYSATGNYSLDAKVGKDGVEYAFEEYLHGVDGEVQITSTSDGTVTNTVYTVEPIPGNHVYLTIDIHLQEAAERALEAGVASIQLERDADNVTAMAEGNYDDIAEDVQGAAVVVVKVDTGEPLVIASYPSYDLSSIMEMYDEILATEYDPLFNRALMGSYAPGSTFKPVTSIASLSEGIINTEETIECVGIYTEYSDAGYTPTCWIYPDGVHGALNVTEALRDSCNYYFYTVSNELGVDLMGEYAHNFGLGVSTGIELVETTGNMSNRENHYSYAGEEWTIGDTLQAGIGQSDSLFTPLQLAEYCAAIANGGTRYSASLLSGIRTYDYSESLYEYEPEVLSTVESADYNWAAVQEGMYLVANDPMGSAYTDLAFYQVEVAAKTGTSQLGEDKTNNGIFICYAPYDDPEIAIAIVVERGGSGSACASIAKDILDAYFSAQSSYGTLESENELLK